LTPEELETLERSQTLIKAAGVVVKGAEAEAGDKIVLPDLTPAAAEVASSSDAATTSSSTSTTVIPPVFTIRMTVSSGTYVRSIVHDIGLAVGSLAHVVVLSRTRQGSFALSTAGSPPKPDGTPAATHECVEWSVFEEAVEVHERAFKIKKEAQAALRKEEKAMGPAALKAKRRAEQEAQRKAMEMAEEEEEMIASAQEPEPVVVSKEEELKAWEREVLAKFDVLD
jgi:tRNA pseudouridine55 synthase